MLKRALRSMGLAQAPVALCALAACGALGLLLPTVASAAPPPIKHVFVIVDENESASTTFGPGSPAPYLSQTLVSQGAFVPNYFGVGHNSLDNYITMVSGQSPNPSTQGDCPTFSDFTNPGLDASGQETGEGCVYPSNVPSLMSQMDPAHLTWRAYEDGMGADPTREAATCGHPAVNTPDNTEGATAADQYATRHDPFVYFHYVIDNTAECNANVVNASRLPTDLASVATTPNFTFITPNLCNDGHDAVCANGGPGGLAQADAYLRSVVPEIVNSPAYKQDGLLIVTFDEAAGSDSSACCGEQPGPFDAANGVQPGNTGPGGGRVGAVMLSPFIKPGTTSTVPYNHYSMLATVEDIFGLSRLAGAQGAWSFGSDVFTNPPPVVIPPPPPPTRAQIASLLAKSLTTMARAIKTKNVSRQHAYSFLFAADESGRFVAQWFTIPPRHHRAVLLATGSMSYGSAVSKKLKVRLTRAGRKLVAKHRTFSYTAKLTFTPHGGTAVSKSKRLRLRF